VSKRFNLSTEIVCRAAHNMEKDTRNTSFFLECTKYFASLRREGRNDTGFEDEFFYTVPAMTGMR
jgi:hypothetical protein